MMSVETYARLSRNYEKTMFDITNACHGTRKGNRMICLTLHASRILLKRNKK